jgi:hypothetical protein
MSSEAPDMASDLSSASFHFIVLKRAPWCPVCTKKGASDISLHDGSLTATYGWLLKRPSATYGWSLKTFSDPMVAVSAVAKGFSDRHLFSDRPSVANIEYLATNRGLLYYRFSNQP